MAAIAALILERRCFGPPGRPKRRFDLASVACVVEACGFTGLIVASPLVELTEEP